MSFPRKEPRANPTEGFAFPRPTRAPKKPKPLRPRPAAPGEPPKFSTLSRSRPMKKAPAKRIAERVADRCFLAWIHQQACCVTFSFAGPGVVIEANHAGIKPGIALKCSDLETLPMERDVHRQWTEYSGRFKSWTRQQRREWADAKIVDHLGRFIEWAPERLAELGEQLRVFANAITDDEQEAAAKIQAQIEALTECCARAMAKRAEVVTRIGATP